MVTKLNFLQYAYRIRTITKPCTLKLFQVTYKLHKAGYWTKGLCLVSFVKVNNKLPSLFTIPLGFRLGNSCAWSALLSASNTISCKIISYEIYPVLLMFDCLQTLPTSYVLLYFVCGSLMLNAPYMNCWDNGHLQTFTSFNLWMISWYCWPANIQHGICISHYIYNKGVN